MVYRGLPDVLGQSFSFEAGSQDVGGSSFCAAADGCESVPNTTVRFGVLHGDSVSGSYDLDLGKGRMERGGFHATVTDRPAFCG
jgi:hypothetical protein